MSQETKDRKQAFKKISMILIILLAIFIILSVILGLIFPLEKVTALIITCTIIIGVIVIGYLYYGLFRFEIVKATSVNKIIEKNYRIIFILITILTLVGTGCFFLDLYLVAGDMTLLTWGSFILGFMALIILGIVAVIGFFKIAEEIKAQL